MRSVLGIDAAWTERHASGVALAVEDANGWRLKGAWGFRVAIRHRAIIEQVPTRTFGAVSPAPDSCQSMDAQNRSCGHRLCHKLCP